MRVLDRESAALERVGVVDFTRFDQFGVTLPFSAMWYTIPAGGSSPPDRHPEVELSVVLDGVALVEAAGTVGRVEAGSSFLLDGDEPHVMHNGSDRPLVVFTAFWAPAAQEAPGV